MNAMLTLLPTAPRCHQSRLTKRSARIQRLTAFIARLRQRNGSTEGPLDSSRRIPLSRPIAPLGLAVFAILTCFIAAAASPARADVLDTWHVLPSVASNMANQSLYVDGYFVTVGNSGKIMRSADAQSWQVIQSPVNTTLTGLVHGGGQFVASGYSGTILTSPDGLTWTQRNSGTDKSLQFLAYGNGHYVAVGSSGTVLHSSDGVTWTPSSFNFAGFTAAAVAFGGDQFVAAGDADELFTSPDGLTWTRRPLGYDVRIESMVYGNGRFVATGWNRVAITSTDGINWTKTITPGPYVNSRLWEVRYLNGRFVAGGQTGLLVSSTNATDWTLHSTGSTGDIASFVYGANRAVLIRSSGAVRGSDTWSPVSDGGNGSGDGSGSSGGSGNGGGSGGSGSGSGSGNGGAGHGGNGGDTSNSSSKLVNISTRAWVGTGSQQLVSGFVIQGAQPVEVLIRAVGPALANYGVTGTLADPQLKLFNGAGAEIAVNDDWGTLPNQAEVLAKAGQVGAFALPAGSKDSVLLLTLQPGVYSVHIGGANNGTGVALAEIYAIGASEGRLVNISSRTQVGAGGDVTISGFVISGDGPRKLLVRGAGPSLARFGVAGVIADPSVKLYDAAQSLVAENNDWTTVGDQAALQAAFSQAGAFSLDAGSKDAAMIVTVNPGLYSVIMSGTGNATGIGLIEIYQLP